MATQQIPSTKLRRALADGVVPSEHPKKVEGLRPHSIRECSDQVGKATCFMYALGLLDAPTSVLIERENILPDSRFIRWLIATKRVTECADPDCQPCIALYFLDEAAIRCKHAAIRFPNGRMRSKWGAYPVYEHALCEVPDNYGDYVLFVTKPSVEQARAFFLEYVGICKRQLPAWARPFGGS
jgi:hypothetical protein